MDTNTSSPTPSASDSSATQSNGALSMTSQSPHYQSPVLKWTLIFAIAIVLNLFWTYATRVIYHEPMYETFCPQSQVIELVETKEACLKVGGQWNANVGIKEPAAIAPEDIAKSTGYASGYCDQSFTCNNNFQEASNVYNRNFFIVFVIVGIASLVLSVFLISSEVVSLGLSFGGVLSLIIGSIGYWSDMNDVVRVVILGLALAALIWLAYKKFK